MEIAKTILEQIKALDFWALGSYGATNYVTVPESKQYSGGVSFKVNGYHHKGWASIKLTYMDEYEISFIVNGGEVFKLVEGVYCDELVTVLDWIEDGD